MAASPLFSPFMTYSRSHNDVQEIRFQRLISEFCQTLLRRATSARIMPVDFVPLKIYGMKDGACGIDSK